MRRHSDDGRKLAHIAAGLPALLLRYLSWWEVVVVLGLALAFNLYALPRISGGRLLRAGEQGRAFHSGVVLYPLSLLVLTLLLPGRLDIVAATWGVLAAGDGMAGLAGRRAGGRRIPWNPEKSLAGTLAFVLAGGAAAVCLAWWCRPTVVPPPYPWFSLWMPVAAALAAALAETIPIRLNDNVTVTATAAAVMWWASLVSEDMVVAAALGAWPLLAIALVVNAGAAAAGYRLRMVSTSGAFAGWAIGAAIFFSTGWAGWVLLLATFGAAVFASRLGLRRKTLLGIEEAGEGRRGAAHAVANTGVATAAAVLAVASYAAGPALVAFVAALVAGSSDTVASEIGKAWGRRTWLVPRMRPVPPGTSGAISVEGTAAGLVAAAALAVTASGLGLIPLDAVIPVIAGATAGAFAESLISAAWEGAGIVNNHVLNFLNTAIAAAAAIGFAG